MPRIFLAQTTAPTPLPQTATALHLSGRNRLGERNHEIWVVISRIQGIGPNIHHLMSRFTKVSHEFFL